MNMEPQRYKGVVLYLLQKASRKGSSFAEVELSAISHENFIRLCYRVASSGFVNKSEYDEETSESTNGPEEVDLHDGAEIVVHPWEFLSYFKTSNLFRVGLVGC